MLKPSWRKVIRDLWDDKARSLLVIISIAIGVFALGMIAGAHVIISEDMDASYEAANPANIKLVTDPFDYELEQTIQRMPEIQDVQGRREITVRTRSGDQEWYSLDLIAVENYSDIRINKLVDIAGSEQLGNHQIFLESNKKSDARDLRLGDLLEIELGDGTFRQIPVVGNVRDETSGTGNLVGNVRGYITLDTLEWLHYPENFNQLYITVNGDKNDKAHIQQVSNLVEDKLNKGGRKVYRTEILQRNQHPMGSIIEALLGVLLVMGILIVFLSGSLIANTLSALMNQQMRQIGVMKLTGARNYDIIRMYVMLILIFALSALAISIPLGVLAAYWLSNYATGFIGFSLQGFRMVPISIILQIIVAILVTLLAGLNPVIHGAKVTIHQAFTGSSNGEGIVKEGAIERALGRMRGISRILLISLRNTFRKKKRLALTLFTLSLGGAIFIAVFNVQVALNLQMERTMRYFLADVNLSFDRLYRTEAIAQALEQIPGITNIEGWIFSNGEILNADGTTGDNIYVFAPPSTSSLVDPLLLEGRWLLPTDEKAITVNENIWGDFPDVHPGSTLRLKIDGKEDDWLVVGIFQFTGADNLFAYTNYEYLAQYLSIPGQAAVYRIATSNHDISFQKSISSQMDSYLKEEGFQVELVEAGSLTLDTVKDYIEVLIVVLLILALLTALVGSIGLAGTLSMNVLERTREIGILRAIGAYDWIVLRLVIVEGLIIGFISYILGALLSFPITNILSNIISMAIFKSKGIFAFTIQGFIIWGGVVIILSILASVIPARNATRMTIREVLAYE